MNFSREVAAAAASHLGHKRAWDDTAVTYIVLCTLSLSNGKMTIAHFRVAGCSKDLMAFHTWLAPKLKRRSKIRTMSQKCLDILELQHASGSSRAMLLEFQMAPLFLNSAAASAEPIL